MKLFLLRHADADTQAATDDARPLSEKGRGQASRMGRFCQEYHVRPELIVASPLIRTDETARLVAAELETPYVTAAFLASGMTPFSALEGLRDYLRFNAVMIVGHEPDFSQLAATLLGMSGSSAIHVRKATLIGLNLDALRPGGAQLEFLIPAKFVG